MSDILLFLAEGFEEIEALSVVDILRRAEIKVTTVSITGEALVTGSHNITIKADCLLSDIDAGKAKMLVLPGGMPGTENLANCDLLTSIIDTFVQEGRFVAAICAAPSILGRRGHLKGKNACSHPSRESMLDGAVINHNPVTVDGNIISSRGMGTAIEFGLTIVEILKGRDVADSISDSIVYKRI